MARAENIGDIEDGYILKYVDPDGDYKIFETPSGRYSIRSVDTDMSFGSNFTSLFAAKDRLDAIKGTTFRESQEIALELKSRGHPDNQATVDRDFKRSPDMRIGQTIPPGKEPVLMYLGGGKDYEVWRSMKNRFTVSKRQPSTDLKVGMTEPVAQQFMKTLPGELAYQQELPDMPNPQYVRPGSTGGDSLTRQIERERLLRILDE